MPTRSVLKAKVTLSRGRVAGCGSAVEATSTWSLKRASSACGMLSTVHCRTPRCPSGVSRKDVSTGSRGGSAQDRRYTEGEQTLSLHPEPPRSGCLAPAPAWEGTRTPAPVLGGIAVPRLLGHPEVFAVAPGTSQPATGQQPMLAGKLKPDFSSP